MNYSRVLVTLAIALTLATCLASQSLCAAEPPITSVAFDPGGDLVLAASQAGLKIYSWPELELQKTIRSSSPNLHEIAFSPDGTKLALAGGTPSETGTVEVFAWPLSSDDNRPLQTLTSDDDSVMTVCWLSNHSIAAGDLAHQVNVWEIEAGKKTSTLSGHSRGVTGLGFLKDENLLVSVGIDQSVRVWKLQQSELIHSLNIHTQPITDLADRPTKSGLPLVASASEDRTVRFWQPTIGRMVRFIRLPSKPLDIAWLPDGSSVLAACTDGHVRFIDPANVEVTRDVEAVKGWCYSIAIHPTDGSFVAAGQNGGLRRITWSTK